MLTTGVATSGVLMAAAPQAPSSRHVAASRAIFHPRRFPDRGHPPTGRFACVRTTIYDS